jgi:hypothetical protein
MWLKNIDSSIPLPFYFIILVFGIIITFISIQLYYQFLTWKVERAAKNGIICSKHLPKLVCHRLHYSGEYKKVRYIDNTKVFIKK